MVWDFQKQLKAGRKGERLFLKHWPNPVRRHETLKGPDFVDSTGAVIELKTDSYDMDKTANVFMERWSDRDLKKPGGPWQAREKGVDVLVYFFINNKTWLVFRDLPSLCREVEEAMLGTAFKDIPNRSWVTQGWAVPRSKLAGLYELVLLEENQ